MKAQFFKIAVIAAAFATLSSCAESTVTNPGNLPDLKHDPILFVHGYLGSTSNFDTMIDRFKADGWADYELYTYQLGALNSNVKNAQELRDKVDEIIRLTGASKVDIIAHSMGSVSSRYYLKNLGGTSNVDAWVSLGGPNHGTDDVDLQNCQTTPCREIAIGSSFLAALNAGDETPGLVRYGTWRSPCDTTINPDESVVLSGATNTLTACIAHFNLLIDPTVYLQVRAFVQ
jgi:triacylglycerol lipase